MAATEIPNTNNPLTTNKEEKKPNLFQRIGSNIKARRDSLNANTIARQSQPKEEPRAEEAKAEAQRLATTSNAISNKASFAQAANNTGEDLATTQKVLEKDPHAETAKVEKAISEQSQLNNPQPEQPKGSQLENIGITPEQIPELKSQVEEMGVDESTDPDTAKDRLANSLLESGLIRLGRDGRYEAVPYDSKFSSIMRGIGTALSIVLGIASGGVLPPINFYNIRSDNDLEMKAAHEKMLSNAVDTLNGLVQTEAEGSYYENGGKEKAEAQGKYNVTKSGQKEMVNINFDNAKEMAQFQNELTKALADYNADVQASMLAREIKSLKDSGLDQKEIIRWIQSMHGQTAANAAADTFGKWAAPITSAVSAAANVVKGGKSDKRFKDFKRGGYKKHERVK